MNFHIGLLLLSRCILTHSRFNFSGIPCRKDGVISPPHLIGIRKSSLEPALREVLGTVSVDINDDVFF